jgi:hypothetical protein
LTAPRLSKALAGPALPVGKVPAHIGNRFLLAARAYHFPSATSFKIILSMVKLFANGTQFLDDFFSAMSLSFHLRLTAPPRRKLS